MRISLNACDFVIFGQHRVWQRGGGGNFPYMIVELEGEIEASAMKAALTRALSRHPVLVGGVGMSLFRLRPFWQVGDGREAEAEEAAARAYQFDDLRSKADAGAALEEMCEARYGGAWYRSSGPQVRLEHYAMPQGRTRLVLRWPHYLMDAEGAQLFLASLGDEPPTVAAHTGDKHAVLLPDHQTPRVLKDYSWLKLIGMIRRGMGAGRALKNVGAQHEIPDSKARFGGYAVLHRHWDGEVFTQMRAAAKRLTPGGPAMFSRFLAAAVCRAQQRLHVERGGRAEAFFITFPMRVGFSRPDGRLFERRPLVGNYLVAPTLRVLETETTDRAVLSAEILRQVEAFLAASGDIAQWALLELAALWHAWFYHLIFKLPLSVNRCSSGFSYYGEIKGHLRTIGNARVKNIWGGGPTTTPPAWNPVFSKFGEQLNLSLTYSRPTIGDDLARRYAELIEDELVNPT